MIALCYSPTILKVLSVMGMFDRSEESFAVVALSKDGQWERCIDRSNELEVWEGNN